MGGLMVSATNFTLPTIVLCLFCKGSGFGQLIQYWTLLQTKMGYHGYPHITRFIKVYVVMVILSTVSALCNFTTTTWVSSDKNLFLIHSPFQFSNITAGDESVTLEVGLSLLYLWMSSMVGWTVWTIFFITAHVIKTDFNFVYHALNKAIQSTALHGSSRKHRPTQNSCTECSGQEEHDVERTGDSAGSATIDKLASGNAMIDIEDARLYHDDACGLLEKADAIFSPTVAVNLALGLFVTSVGLYQVVYGTTTDDSGFLFSMMSVLPFILFTVTVTSCIIASCVLVNKCVSKPLSPPVSEWCIYATLLLREIKEILVVVLTCVSCSISKRHSALAVLQLRHCSLIYGLFKHHHLVENLYFVLIVIIIYHNFWVRCTISFPSHKKCTSYYLLLFKYITVSKWVELTFVSDASI